MAACSIALTVAFVSFFAFLGLVSNFDFATFSFFSFFCFVASVLSASVFSGLAFFCRAKAGHQHHNANDEQVDESGTTFVSFVALTAELECHCIENQQSVINCECSPGGRGYPALAWRTREVESDRRESKFKWQRAEPFDPALVAALAE